MTLRNDQHAAGGHRLRVLIKAALGWAAKILNLLCRSLKRARARRTARTRALLAAVVTRQRVEVADDR